MSNIVEAIKTQQKKQNASVNKQKSNKAFDVIRWSQMNCG